MLDDVTTRLLSAVGRHDKQTTMACMNRYVFDATLVVVDRKVAVGAITNALNAFPQDAEVLGGVLCALDRVSGEATLVAVPMAGLLRVTKPFEHRILLVQACARLLSHHNRSQRVLEALPQSAEACARWLARYPDDDKIGYWCAHALCKAAGQEPEDVKAKHGTVGCDRVDVAVVAGATAARHFEVQVHGEAWSQFLLDRLYPRLRACD